MRVFMSSMEVYYDVKRIVRRKIGDKKPFLIEWVGYPEAKDYTWEPYENLSDKFKSKFCKNGKVRKTYRKMNKKENVSLNKPKRKRNVAFPPVPHKPENHAVIPEKRPRGAVEYSEYENGSGESILVVKTYEGDKVDYQHFRRISHTVREENGGLRVRSVEPSVQYV